MKATLELSVYEYKEAIYDYISKHKLLPDGIDKSNIEINKYGRGGVEIKPRITYSKGAKKQE